MFLVACAGDKTAKEGGVRELPASKEVLSADEYTTVIAESEHELEASTAFKDYSFSIKYIPHHVQALRNFKEDSNRDSLMNQFIKNNQTTAFFMLKIAKTGDVVNQDLVKTVAKAERNYTSVLEYFSFNMQQDVKLVVDKDTFPCVLWHYERGFDAKPNATFLLSFNLKNNPETAHQDLTLNYEDHLFGVGILNLKIKKEPLTLLPQLKI
ncbi:MAG: hypothetical protein EAY81_04125 [Bacteroidetes bacterium]|nr:MAG: hypothetical protein EAY81_04125 [Bacteroidota bacterium]